MLMHASMTWLHHTSPAILIYSSLVIQ